MNLNFDKSAASGYKSASQQARVLTESWILHEMFCPNCGQQPLYKYANNDPVRDFSCGNCHEDFELKSTRKSFSTKIVDGDYRSMVRRLTSNAVPNLFALAYAPAGDRVLELIVVPSHFFVPAVIERRKPLARTARRAGWTGCNILFSEIPQIGRVNVVAAGQPNSKSSVMSAWQHTLFLREQKKPDARGWVLDVIRCIEDLRAPRFHLADVYSFEGRLSALHPHNRHIRAKIRQQLQKLRDAGYLKFDGRGHYTTTQT